MAKSITHIEFVKEVYNKVGCEYSVLSLFVKSKTKITMKHNNCGHVYEVTPNHFMYDNSRCPNCFKNHKITTDQFKKEVLELTGVEYLVIGEYLNARTKVKIRHNSNECNNYEFEKLRNNFLSGQRCPNCGNKEAGRKQAKTHGVFIQEVSSLYNNEYTVIGDYVTTLTPIKMKHNKCGHEWKTRPGDFLKGKKCPKCNESKAEDKINIILSDLQIDFKSQFRFEDCRSKRKLPFDFAIFKDNHLVFLIEYDGEHHYKPIRYSDKIKAEKKLNERKSHDQIKNDYCLKNNIPLLRIPYWDYDNIENIVKEELSKYINWNSQKVV